MGVLLMGVMVGLGGCRDGVGTRDVQGKWVVELNGHRFHLELALDDGERMQGLSDRREIAEDGGMLFVFPRAEVVGFVMRRCLVPIDAVFVDAGGRVVKIAAMQVEPYETAERDLRVYSSDWPVQFVIELAGGTAGKIGLSAGQKVDIGGESLKAQAR